jgi:hypothetical protein
MTVKGIGPVVHAHRPYFHCRDFCEHWQLLIQPAAEHSADQIPSTPPRQVMPWDDQSCCVVSKSRLLCRAASLSTACSKSARISVMTCNSFCMMSTA